MSSIQEFLKDGSRHYQGTEEATLRNIEACKDLTQVVRTSLGPNGMNKMVINHLEKLFVTSDAATIIKELEVVHPAAKMVVMASKQQEQEVGDNTNLVVVFAGELLQQAESLIRMGLHISDIVFGYKKAGAKALELLETLVISSLDNLKDQALVEKAIRSAVTSKQLEWEHHLVPAIAKACIETLPQNPSAFNVDSVRCCKITGGSVADTQFIHGFALVKDVNGTIRHVKNAKVVVFAGGIEAPKTESKGTVLLTTADELLNYSKGEESQMETIVKNIADSGANVVVSGGAISALALHYLERYKIMVLREGSKFQLRRICRATGATPLARVGKPLPEELGECEEVTVDEVGSTKVTFFRNSSERCQIATLLIRGPTQNTMDDVERAVDDAVNVYKALIRDPRLLAGAGASELELARILMPFGDAAPGLDQYAIKKYAEALEVIPRILADNSGLDSSEIVSSLYAAHTQGKTTFGVNVEAAEIGDAVAINVFDAFIGKYWALKLATDAALTILQVDQIIMAKAADGPKVPQMGARDAD
mmetsp:Transcript_21195/g.35405  ORF Transcript_21195/g.35405 Transcript_21195/m.35405 type:complete len:537 (+) Transcript_21195:33-1643(+)